MLSSKTIEIVKSTAPVLEVYGEQITSCFYQLMFQNHPELLNVFNRTHQHEKSQSKVLAQAVYAAAANIDQLDKIIPAVQRIAHKHRSIGVSPEQYPIVGKYLLLAIKDVLGDAATDEIINAWAETYQVLADVFIQAEAELYHTAQSQRGGWEGYRDFVVVKKVEESKVITSFYLKPADGKELASFKPGQYISVKVEDEDEEYTQIRQYSLSDTPGKDYYRISVKREDAIQGKPAGQVSNYLHREVHVGTILPISAPAGDFYLDEEKETPVVLISGGVGLTPLMSMLNTMIEKKPTRQVTFIHAAINGSYHAMKEKMTQAKQNENIDCFICYERPTTEDQMNQSFEHQGYIDANWLKSILPTTQADFYFCGPTPFMQAVLNALTQLGVEEESIHYEFFGPSGQLQASQPIYA